MVDIIAKEIIYERILPQIVMQNRREYVLANHTIFRFEITLNNMVNYLLPLLPYLQGVHSAKNRAYNLFREHNSLLNFHNYNIISLRKHYQQIVISSACQVACQIHFQNFLRVNNYP